MKQESQKQEMLEKKNKDILNGIGKRLDKNRRKTGVCVERRIKSDKRRIRMMKEVELEIRMAIGKVMKGEIKKRRSGAEPMIKVWKGDGMRKERKIKPGLRRNCQERHGGGKTEHLAQWKKKK